MVVPCLINHENSLASLCTPKSTYTMTFHNHNDDVASLPVEDLLAMTGMGAANNANGNSGMSQTANGNGSSGLYPPPISSSASLCENGENRDALTMSCSLSCSTPPSLALLQERQQQEDNGCLTTTEMSAQRMLLQSLLATLGTSPSSSAVVQTLSDSTSATNPPYQWSSSDSSSSPYHQQQLQLLLHQNLGVFEPRPIRPDTEDRLRRRRRGSTSATTTPSASDSSAFSSSVDTTDHVARAAPCFVSCGSGETTAPAPRKPAEGPSFMGNPLALPGMLQATFDDMIQVERLPSLNSLRTVVDPDSSLPSPSFELSAIGPAVQFHQQRRWGSKVDNMDHRIMNYGRAIGDNEKKSSKLLSSSSFSPSSFSSPPPPPFIGGSLKSDMCAKSVSRQQVALQDTLERHSFIESDPNSASLAHNSSNDSTNTTDNKSTVTTMSPRNGLPRHSVLEETKDGARSNNPKTSPTKASSETTRKKLNTKTAQNLGDSKDETIKKTANHGNSKDDTTETTARNCPRKMSRSTQKVQLDKHVLGPLRGLMTQSASSQQQLQIMDERNGLPKSHCQTMVNSSRSRKQLQDGIILPKWNGAPLIDTDSTNNTGGAPRRRMGGTNKRKRCQG